MHAVTRGEIFIQKHFNKLSKLHLVLSQRNDPRQGGHLAGPAAPNLLRQAARGQPHARRLQYPEGVDAASRDQAAAVWSKNGALVSAGGGGE